MAMRMKQVFIDDLRPCTIVSNVDDLPRDSFLHRLLQSLVRLVSPLM